MINLLELEPQKISRDIRGKFALIYGAPGCGKTTLASKFEKALILSFESGSNGLNNTYVVPIKTWREWKQLCNQLIREEALKDKFFSLAIDTVDEAYKLCEKWLCQEHGVETIKDVAAFGGGYKLLDDEFMSTFRSLAYAGYGLNFISHETEKAYTDDNGKEYNKIVPALPNRPFLLINKFVDIITYIRDIPIEVGENIEHKRFMFFRSDERFLTKSRFKYITPRIELDYNEFVKAIQDAIDKEIEMSGGEATDAPNPYNIRSFDELMDEAKEMWIKADGNRKETILNVLEEEFGKPTKFSEILPEQRNELEQALIKLID